MVRHSQELKEQVLIAWKAGASEMGLASVYNVPRQTLQKWVKGHERAVTKTPEYDLDEMARGLVSGSFGTLANIHGVTEDNEWLKRQNANDLAILYGVTSDKLIRLLGAVKPDGGKPDESALDLHPTAAVGTRLD